MAFSKSIVVVLLLVSVLAIELEGRRIAKSKAGTCPRSLSLHRSRCSHFSRRRNTCTSDYSCAGNQKCCGGCPTKCEDPIPVVKPGSCPPISLVTPEFCTLVDVFIGCDVESDCEGDLKCCTGPCGGRTCTLDTVPSLICPAVERPLPEICSRIRLAAGCRRDSDCRRDELCCPSFCAVKDCVSRPVPPTAAPTFLPTISPTRPPTNLLCPIQVSNPLPPICARISFSTVGICGTDADCSRNEICCPNLCGVRFCEAKPQVPEPRRY